MDTLIQKLNSTTSMPAGVDRNHARDAIFQEMVATAAPTLPFFHDSDIGNTLANIAIATVTNNTVQLRTYQTHPSPYVAYKARKALTNTLLTTGCITEDTFLGCLMGGAVGDAVGLPVEGYPREACQQYVHEIVQPVTTSTYHRHNFTFGQYSDDTQLSRETYLTVIQGRGKMDPAIYALRIATLFQPGAYRVVGYGKQTATAAEAIRQGKHYTESGCAKGQGNGSVMRSPALGVLLVRKSKEEIIHTTRVMSAITHASSASMDGSVAVALATQYAALTSSVPFQPEHFLEYIATGVSPDFAPYVHELHQLRHASLDEAAKRITEIGVSNKERRWGTGISIGARQTALWALYSFLRAPDSFKDCLSWAIAVGGDVDTTAATAGAICGARVGYAALPTQWTECLHDYHEWTFPQLLNMAKSAYEYVATNTLTVAL